jgi:hypothetical protein
MAGYSQTPLIKKLGIQPLHRLALLQAPEGFSSTLGQLPDDVCVSTTLDGASVFDVIVFFTDNAADLAGHFLTLKRHLSPPGGLWIAWPKKASGVPTDLTEDRIRELVLKTRLVDNKVCAVDDTWSGLRFVIRLQDRKAKKYTRRN